MKKLLSFVIAGLVLTAVIGCTSTNEPKYEQLEFPTENKGFFQLISEEPLYAGTYFRIVERGNSLFVFGGSQETHTAIHIYEKQTGSRIGEYLHYGRGPKEYLYDVNSYYDKESAEYRIYDVKKGVRFSFDLDSLVKAGIDAINTESLHVHRGTDRIFESAENYIYFNNPSYMWMDTTTLQRIVVKNKLTGKTNSYNEYPLIEDDRVRWHLYNNPRIAVSPNHKNMVVSTYYGNIFEIFSIDGQVKEVSRKYYLESFIEGGEFSPKTTDKTQNGFLGLYATDSKIYGIYEGSASQISYYKLPPEERGLIFNKVVVFDWAGNPLKKIITDYFIYSICLSEDESVLYAVVRNEYGEAFLAKLDMRSLEE